MANTVDLSSFPLLRVDELHLHNMDTLLEAKDKLIQMTDSPDDLRVYAKKLIERIKLEIVHRTIDRVNSMPVEDHSSNNQEIEREKTFTGKKNRIFETNHRLDQAKPPSNVTKAPSSLARPTIPITPNFVSSPNGHRKSSFLTRSKRVLISLKSKHERMFNARAIQSLKLQEDKERRRSEAVYRLKDRLERDEITKFQTDERKRAKLEAKIKRREAEIQVISQMERAAAVATSTISVSEDEKITAEQILVTGAIAAIEILKESNIDNFDASDSGSSLSSDVNEGYLSETCNTTESLDIEVDDLKRFNAESIDDDIETISSQSQINSNVVEIFQSIQLCDATHDLKVQDSDERNNPILEIFELGIQNHTSPQFPDREPGSPCKSKVDAEVVDQNIDGSRSNEGSKLLQSFPSFRSIFSALASDDSAGISDLKLKKERECLEYQVNVASRLFEVRDRGDASKLLFRVKSPREEVNFIIHDVLLSFDSDEGEWDDISETVGVGNCWNLLWTWSKPKINRDHLLSFQRISRFEGVSCLTRKDLLKKQLERSQPNVTLMPQTYVLPHQFNGFISSFTECSKMDQSRNPNIWIMKPVGMSRGRGITLIDDIVDVSYARPTVIQKYITNPLLFDGFKFDIRLYVLVTSFNPLEAFIYREGLARFGSRRFCISSIRLNDQQVHLTNSSIQKEYDDDIQRDHPARLAGKHGGGNKTRLSWAFDRLQQNSGIDTKALWREISKLCLRTLQSVDKSIQNQPNSFEVFGFDVIIDTELKPWLIEVNACPSLARESHLDVAVKEAMIRDTITIVQPCAYDRNALAEVCKRRLHHRKRSMKDSLSDRHELEQDLIQIFGKHTPRLFGELPKMGTDFEQIAPIL